MIDVAAWHNSESAGAALKAVQLGPALARDLTLCNSVVTVTKWLLSNTCSRMLSSELSLIRPGGRSLACCAVVARPLASSPEISAPVARRSRSTFACSAPPAWWFLINTGLRACASSTQSHYARSTTGYATTRHFGERACANSNATWRRTDERDAPR